MLKKFILLGVLAYSLHAYAQVPAAGVDHGLKATWNSPSIYCTTTTTSACIKDYTETITPPTGVTSGVIPLTVTSSSDVSGVVTSSWKPGGTLFCGTWTVSVVANYLNFGGVAATSNPVSTTVLEPCPFVANPVTGLGISLIP